MTKKLLTLTFVGLSTIANLANANYGYSCPHYEFENAMAKAADKYTKSEAVPGLSALYSHLNDAASASQVTASTSYMDQVKAGFTQSCEKFKAAFGSFSTSSIGEKAQGAMGSVKGAPQAAFKAVDGAVKNDPRVFGALYAGGLATAAAGIGVAGKSATKETEAPAHVKVSTNMDKVKEMGQKAFAYGKDHKGALATVAVAVPVAVVASKVFVKKYKASQKPTIEQLAKDAKNLKEFAYSLNLHGYTRVDFEKANVEMPRGGKVYIMSQLA